MPIKEFLTETEVSEITGIPLKTLRNLRYLKKTFTFYKINKSVRYRLSEVREAMEKSKIKVQQ